MSLGNVEKVYAEEFLWEHNGVCATCALLFLNGFFLYALISVTRVALVTTALRLHLPKHPRLPRTGWLRTRTNPGGGTVHGLLKSMM